MQWRDVRRLDLNAKELGVPVEELMRNAGLALARVVQARTKKGAQVVVFCGKGHNGGDGLAAAVELQRKGVDARVVLADEPQHLAAACRSFFRALAAGSWTVWDGRTRAPWSNAQVIVDALLGAGQEGPPRGAYAQIVRHIRKRAADGATVVACDIPTGLGTKLSVEPAQTVTFHARKEGMERGCGKVIVAPIGIPSQAEMAVGLGDLWLGYRVPRPDSHKGDNGRVLVVAGSVPLTGAPHYVAMGAYRSGADLVHVVTPGPAAATLRAFGPHAIVHDQGSAPHLAGLDKALALLRTSDVLVIGPGLGRHPQTRRASARIIEAAGTAGMPLVIDADALDALDDELLRRHGSRMVLTPHAGEFRDLAGLEATSQNVQAYARRHGVTVVRKAHVSVVADAGRHRLCKRGSATMTVGGTGDVLAGCLGALLAKGAPPFEAACAATYLLGVAGEAAARDLSWGATATDLADRIPEVLLQLAAVTAALS